MRIKSDHVLQFKVTLLGIKPPIWRRIVVLSDATFWDLHVAIQDAMGWQDLHLHEFNVPAPLLRCNYTIGIPDDEIGPVQDPVFPGWLIPVAQFFNLINRRAIYEYDFGDGWEHEVRLEKILPRDKNVQYPVCTGGRRACPPEDCGGIGGYEAFLAAIADPAHAEHEDLLAWVGGEFDPERFDKDTIQFDAPLERWHSSFEQESRPAGRVRDDPRRGSDSGWAAGLDLPAGEVGSHRWDESGEGRGWDGAVRNPAPVVAQMQAQARLGFRGYPVATVVLYGPNDRHATKVAVGIVAHEAADADPLERWTIDTGDVRENNVVMRGVLAFLRIHSVRTVILADRIMGCPHEEGIDYPLGESCPECVFWSHHDRRTGDPIQ